MPTFSGRSCHKFDHSARGLVTPMEASAVDAHADYLNITVPFGESADITDVVLEAVAAALPHPRPNIPNVWDIGTIGKQVGTMKLYRRGEVFIISFSGLALLFLRANECFGNLLWAFANRPHRVSHLDAALDLPGVEASPIVLDLYRQGIARGGYRLSQRLAPVDSHFGIGKHGTETGTVYVGAKDARISLAVYDKREEQVKKGRLDPGPMIRYEMRFRGGSDGVPLTLRDAADPTAVFWHYMPPVILRPARGVSIPEWVKSDDVGYRLPPRVPRTPEEILRRWVENVGMDGLKLADAVGPYGRGLMASLMHLTTSGRRRE